MIIIIIIIIIKPKICVLFVFDLGGECKFMKNKTL